MSGLWKAFKNITRVAQPNSGVQAATTLVEQLRTRWGRQGSGPGARRERRRLMRRMRKEWCRRFQADLFPARAVRPARVASEDIWIVIPELNRPAVAMAAAAGMVRQPRNSPDRKSLRGFIHDAVGEQVRLHLAKVGTAATPPRAQPRSSSVMAAGGQRRPVATIETLEPVGAVLMSGLTAEMRRDLQEAGARVIPNLEVRLISPVEEKDVTGPGAQGAAAGHGGGATMATLNTWHLNKIGHARAKALNLTGKGIKLGFLDTGINIGHPEFKGRVVRYQEFDASGAPLAGRNARDHHGHGTQIAALAGGNHVGVAQEVEFVMAAVLTKKCENGEVGGTLVQILKGLRWLIAEKVHLINMSLTLRDCEPDSSEADEKADIERTIREATVTSSILTIAASGNDGDHVPGRVHSPAIMAEVKAVGATDRNDEPARFSCWNMAGKPGIYAPGVNVHTANGRTGRYCVDRGTSLATALVTGAAALLLHQEHLVNQNILSKNPGILKSHVKNLSTPIVTSTNRTLYRLDLSRL